MQTVTAIRAREVHLEDTNMHHSPLLRVSIRHTDAVSPPIARAAGNIKKAPPPYRGTSLTRNTPPYDPTVALFLGTYRGPRGVGVSHERGTPVGPP